MSRSKPFSNGVGREEYQTQQETNMKIRMLNPGQPCRKCGSPVVRVDRSPMKKYARKQTYAYSWWLKCPACGEIYMVESAKYKIERKRESSLFG